MDSPGISLALVEISIANKQAETHTGIWASETKDRRQTSQGSELSVEDRELAQCRSVTLHFVVFKTHVALSSPVQFLQASVDFVEKSQSSF